MRSLGEARATARDVERPLLALVTAGAWCRPCEWLEDRGFGETRIERLVRERFVAVKLYDHEEQHLELPVQAYPSLFFYTADGTLLEAVAGPPSVSALEALLVRYGAGGSVVDEARRIETGRGLFVYVGRGSWERRVGEEIVPYREYDRDDRFVYLESDEAPRHLALPPKGGAVWQWDPVSESWEEFSTASPE